MKRPPITTSKLSISSWIQLIMGIGTLLVIELLIAIVYPFVGIPIFLLSCWWLLKQPVKVRFYEEEMEVSYIRRKRIIPYTTIEYLRFDIPTKSDPVLSLKIIGERKVITFEYGNNSAHLALIFNIFRSRSVRIKDREAKSRRYVELVGESYSVKGK